MHDNLLTGMYLSELCFLKVGNNPWSIVCYYTKQLLACLQAATTSFSPRLKRPREASCRS